MMVLLGILMGVTVFVWAQRLYGFWPAVAVLALYTTEPNILAHAGLVTTDFGLACFTFVAFYFLWRANEQLTLKTLVPFIAFFTLAQISKFSALILWPTLFVLLLIRVLRSNSWMCHLGWLREFRSRANRMLAAFGIVATLALVSYTSMWAVYGFRYAPAPEGSGLEQVVTVPSMLERVPHFAKGLNWIDHHHLLPNVCTQGFLLGQGLAQQRSAYLMGKISNVGWWYYFPAAFLIKTPIALLLLFFGGLALMITRRGALAENNVFFLVPVATFMLIAMTAVHLNIGLRHILPIYPFVLLIAGRAVTWLWESQRKLLRAGLFALCLFQIEENVLVYPHYLAFFNKCIGGPQNGYKYLADSNLDWGQDLKPLKKWMDEHDIKAINLSYFGHADPAYYGIKCFYLPPVPFFATGRDDGPRLPGYVAVSVQNLLGLSMYPPRPDLYKKLLESEPVAVIGYSIRVYWVERPWW
jgi:hypothetical protein